MIEEMLKSKRKSNYYQQNKSTEYMMFRIVCKNCNLALRPQIRQKKDPNDQIKIMGSIQKNDSIKQLWMFKQLKDGKFEIVNFWTDSVIESDLNGVRLDRGLQIPSQKFQIEFVGRNLLANIQNKREIRLKDTNGKYLTLDGILDAAKFDEADQGQIYVLEEASPENYKQFQDTYLLIEAQSKKALDVVQGSEKSGAEVCIYYQHRRANQRWLFEPDITDNAPEEVKYSIINLLSGKRLWFGKDKDLIQEDNQEKIWQIRKKHDFSGELYCTKKQKYLNRVEEDKIRLENNSNGTKWNVY